MIQLLQAMIVIATGGAILLIVAILWALLTGRDAKYREQLKNKGDHSHDS